MSLMSMLKPNGKSGFGYGSTAEDVTAGLDLTGRTVLITGCNSGLGLEASRVLAMRGAHVLGTARTADKATAALSALSGRTTGLACELADPTSVRACVAAVSALDVRLDAIVCNAGIMALPKLQQAHGYELQFFTNHIGHFLLVTGLLDRLTDRGRVVMVSSEGHRMAPSGGIEFDNLSGARKYNDWRAYGQSKLANVLFAAELARRFAGTGRVANSLHPGVIHTNLGRNMAGPLQFLSATFLPLLQKSVPQGAATEVWAAVHPDTAALNGEYLADCNVAKASAHGRDADLARRLWEASEQIVAQLP
jgi:NAD(P)-dependent dehydrogenase (short-subunit alcohol dehydrogenase family)